jgi:hypothetical protein
MNETECSTNLCATVAVAYDEMITFCSYFVHDNRSEFVVQNFLLGGLHRRWRSVGRPSLRGV